MNRTDLIAKLEAASEGSSVLDGQIMLAMGEGFTWPENTHVTTSIDAAGALIEKMLPSWSIQIMIERRSKEPPWFCVHMQDSEYISLYWHEGDADGNAYSQAYSRATPSIALCIALLRALDAEEAAEKAEA